MYIFFILFQYINGGKYMSKNKKSNSNIKCDVASCNYNNCKEGTCSLEEIKVSCSCDNDECLDCGETICQSFETTSSNINDNEYEVQSEMEDEDTNETEGE